MSTSTTTNLQLIKENADEPILRSHRQHTNDNLDTLDGAIKAVQDATATLEKARLNLVNLIGNIGKDENNADLITKAQARATLDVAQSNGAASTLYAAEQAIATNASAISSLRDSVSGELRVQLVYGYSFPANDSVVNVTAPDISGYSFLCWFMAYSDTWRGLVYPGWAIGKSTDFFTTETSTVARKIVAGALYVKTL